VSIRHRGGWYWSPAGRTQAQVTAWRSANGTNGQGGH
jgi:hypothetical protein